jgi:hypothetical protein
METNMRLKFCVCRTVLVLVSVSLSACTVERTPDGGYSLNSESLHQMLPSSSTNQVGTPVPADQQISYSQRSDITDIKLPKTMNFQGLMEGGQGSVDLKALGHNKYHIGLQVQSSNGYGVVVGVADLSGNTLVMRQGYEPGRNGTLSGNPAPCDISLEIKNNGHSIDVGEKNCSTFHGSQVSFNGSLNRTN